MIFLIIILTIFIGFLIKSPYPGIEFKRLLSFTKTHKNNDRTNLQSAIDDLPKIIANPVPNNYAKKDEIAIGKKGSFGENVLEEIFNQRYGDIQFEKKK